MRNPVDERTYLAKELSHNDLEDLKGTFPPARWIAAVVLLVGEIGAIKLRFSSATLPGGSMLWAWLMGHTSYILSFILMIAIASMITGHRVLRMEWARVSTRSRPWNQALPIFGIHLGAFASFFFLTGFTFEGGISAARYPLAWVLLWGTMGLATALSWSLAGLPAGAWIDLIRGSRAVLIRGLIVGSVAAAAGWGTEQLWAPLARGTFQVVRSLLDPIYPDMTGDLGALTLGTSRFSVSIHPRCSGYEGIGLICVFLAFYLWYFRETVRYPRAFLLFPVGIVSVWLANSVRIAALIAIGTSISPAVAAGGFHLYSGWLLMIAVSLGLIAATRQMRFFARPDFPHAGEPIAENPAAAYLGPLLAVTAMGMVTGAISAGFDWFYPLRVFAAAAALWYFRRAYSEAHWTWSWQAVATGAGACVVWLVLGRPSTSLDVSWHERLAGLPREWAATWFFLKTLGYVIIAPVVEELAFRGYLMRRTVAADFTRVPVRKITVLSMLVTSVLFGTMHGQFWLPATVSGLFFAWAFCRRGRIADAILAHATTNALIVVYALASGDWSRWS